MSATRELLFDLLLNALVQIGCFAILTGAFARMLKRVKASRQHIVYVAVLLFCLIAPLVNTIRQSPSSGIARGSQMPLSASTTGSGHGFRGWQNTFPRASQLAIAPQIQTWVVCIWGVFVLLRLTRFAAGVGRVRSLRRSAWKPADQEIMPAALSDAEGIDLQLSDAVDGPVTIGAFRPAILLPSQLVAKFSEQDFRAILAHELAHIRRKDFALNIALEVLTAPVAWHPGIAYLMARISQTRELACDEYAADRFGQRRSYANTLVRLASLCLATSRCAGEALGIFDGNNFEDRIMALTKSTLTLSRSGALGLALVIGSAFGVSELLAQATSIQSSTHSNTAADFAGTWHWMFQGHSFATMNLKPDGTGTVTESRIAIGPDGELTQADASDNSLPKQISKASVEGSALHVQVPDENGAFEFDVILKNATQADIRPKGAPANMKPILAERAQ